MTLQQWGTLYLGFVLISVPLARFHWDFWSQHFIFLSLLFFFILAFSKLFFQSHFNGLFPSVDPENWNSPACLSLLLFLVCFSISSFLSPFRELTRNQYLHCFNAISCYWIGKNLTAHFRSSLQKLICGTSSLFSIFYLLANLIQGTGVQKQAIEFYLNANLISSFTLLSFFIALNCMKDAKLLASAAIVLNSIAFCFTHSMGGILGGAVALLYLLFSNRLLAFHPLKLDWRNFLRKWDHQFKEGRRWPVLALFFIALLGIAVIFYIPWPAQSWGDRWRWWSASLQILFQSPFFGNGPGSYEKIAEYFMDPGLKSMYAHSFLLQTASELGLPATLFLFYFFFSQIKNRSAPFLSAGLLAVLIQNLFDFSMHVPGISLHYWILLSFLSNAESPTPALRIQEIRGAILPLLYLLSLCAILFSGWRWGLKPLFAFQESLNAQDYLDKMDLESAEKSLSQAIGWDGLPAKYYSDLSLILALRYQRAYQTPKEPQNQKLIQESIKMQKEALRSEPLSPNYKKRMEYLLKLNKTNVAF